MKVKCDSCNNLVERTKSKLIRNKHNFCNKTCQLEWNKMEKRKTHITTTCEQCGKTFSTLKIYYIRNNHHFCNRYCLYAFKIGRKIPKIRYKINLNPTFDLGWVCGAIMGDGSLPKNNKAIHLYSNDKNLLNIYLKKIKEIIPDSKARITISKLTSKNNISYVVAMGCNNFYEKLKPFKPEPFKWYVPDFLTSEDSIRGFISGLFDTDGCISKDKKHNGRLRVWSKYDDGLKKVARYLNSIGIKAKFYQIPDKYEISICKNKSLIIFKNKIGFQLPRKREKLEKVISDFYVKNKPYYSAKDKYTADDYYSVIDLRKKTGWGSKKISDFLNIDISGVECWIYRHCKPLSVRTQEDEVYE